MKLLILSILLLVINTTAQVTPCEDAVCDSLALRAILDSNGWQDIPVDSVSEKDSSTGRIISFEPAYLNERDFLTLPSEIGKLSALEIIIISTFDFDNIPPEIGQLKSLKVFSIHSSAVRNLPPEMGNLEQLILLEIMSSELTGLPPTNWKPF